MIAGEAGVLMSLLAIIAFNVLVVLITITVLMKCTHGYLLRYSATARRRVLWLIALSPWLMGLLATVPATASGSYFLGSFGSDNFLHLRHPHVFIPGSWHAVFAVIAVFSALILVSGRIRHLQQRLRQTRSLHALAEADGRGFYQLDTDVPAAFTAGFLQPQCYITTALRHQLSPQEYAILRLHEQEHARQFDPLKKWFFQLLAVFFPRQTAARLNQSMVMAMEQCADAAVHRDGHDKSLIAMTLLKVSRMLANPFAGVPTAEAACHFCSTDVEQRIQYLLSDFQGKSISLPGAAFVVIIMTCLCAVSADFFHHVIEFIFSHQEFYYAYK